MRTIRIRRHKRGSNTKLYAVPLPDVGDKLLERGNGFSYRMVNREGQKIVWEFDCKSCGRPGYDVRSISFRPTKRLCEACK